MTSSLDQPLVHGLADLLSALEEVDVPHMIIGGLAVIARGIVRHTDDADATVWAADISVHALLECLARHGNGSAPRPHRYRDRGAEQVSRRMA